MEEKTDIWKHRPLTKENESILLSFVQELKNEEKVSTHSYFSLLRGVNYKIEDVDIDMTKSFCLLDQQELEKQKRTILHRISSRQGLTDDEINLFHTTANVLKQILESIVHEINETGFINICKMLMDKNYAQNMEIFCSDLILPKVQEKEETSPCIINIVKQLAELYSKEISHHVLLPLLSCINSFTDSYFLSTIYSVLFRCDREQLISTLLLNKHFTSRQWILLSAIVPFLTVSSIMEIINFVYNHCDSFNKCKNFSNFLVSLCCNLKIGITHKILHLLSLVIQRNETLLKKQAKKALDNFLTTNNITL